MHSRQVMSANSRQRCVALSHPQHMLGVSVICLCVVILLLGSATLHVYPRFSVTKLDYLISIAPSFWRLGSDLGRELLLKLGSIAPPACIPSFECGICLEEHEVRNLGVMIANCEHLFCRDCLLGHVKTKLTESQYPIRCPTCSTERGRLDPGSGFCF